MQELGDAVCPDVIRILLCVIPGKWRSEEKETHAQCRRDASEMTKVAVLEESSEVRIGLERESKTGRKRGKDRKKRGRGGGG